MTDGNEMALAPPARVADFQPRQPSESLSDFRRRCWELVLSNRSLVTTAIRLKYRPRTRQLFHDLFSFAAVDLVERLSSNGFDPSRSALANWIVRTVGWSLGNRGFFEVTGWKRLDAERSVSLVPISDVSPTRFKHRPEIRNEWGNIEPAAKPTRPDPPAGEVVFATARAAIHEAPMDARKKGFLEESLVEGASSTELAERHRITRQRVQQITSAAMRRFRETLHVTESGRRLEEIYEVFCEARNRA